MNIHVFFKFLDGTIYHNGDLSRFRYMFAGSLSIPLSFLFLPISFPLSLISPVSPPLSHLLSPSPGSLTLSLSLTLPPPPPPPFFSISLLSHWKWCISSCPDCSGETWKGKGSGRSCPESCSGGSNNRKGQEKDPFISFCFSLLTYTLRAGLWRKADIFAGADQHSNDQTDKSHGNSFLTNVI